jgi:hypothetical protein
VVGRAYGLMPYGVTKASAPWIIISSSSSRDDQASLVDMLCFSSTTLRVARDPLLCWVGLN